MLQEQDRIKLDGIVSQMTANKESDANVQFVVNDFKQKYSTTETTQPAQQQGYLSAIGADIKAIGGDIAKRFETARVGVEKAQQGKQGVASAMLQTTGQIAGGVGDVIYRGVKAIAPEFVEQGIKKGVTAITETKPIQDITAGYQSWKQQHPEAAANLEAVANIGSVLPIGKAPQIASKVSPAIKTGAEKTVTLAKQLPSKAEENLIQNLNETFKKGTIGVKNISDYAESRGVNLGQEIVSRKIKPIVENDRLKFGTEPFKILDDEIASDSRLIDEAIKQYPDTRIPAHDAKIGVALQIAKDPTAIRQGAVSDMTTKALEKIDDFIVQTGRADFSLREIQNFKKGMWEASKKFKIAETGKSDAYSELGKYFKGVIEAEVPDVKIQEINAKIGRAQETYKMLDKINSLQDGGIVLKGGKVGRYTTDVIGAGVGGALGSAGGPIGGAIGAATGYKISSLIRGLSQKSAILGPIDRILIKFAKDAPENTAIKEAKSFIDAIKAGWKPTITPRVQSTIEKALPMDTPIEIEMGTYKFNKNKTTGRVEMEFKPKSQSVLDKSTQTSAKANAKAISKTVPQTTPKSKGVSMLSKKASELPFPEPKTMNELASNAKSVYKDSPKISNALDLISRYKSGEFDAKHIWGVLSSKDSPFNVSQSHTIYEAMGIDPMGGFPFKKLPYSISKEKMAAKIRTNLFKDKYGLELTDNEIKKLGIDENSMVKLLDGGSLPAKPINLNTPSPLHTEALKYKTAEEYVKAQPIKDDVLEGAMGHRPSRTGATADNVSQEVSEMGMPDFYAHPEYYNYGGKEYSESINALMKLKGKPNAEVTIYRASPKNELRTGDWVTLSKEKARLESLTEKTGVQSFKVKASEIEFAGDDVTEFGYWGHSTKTKSQLTDIWKEVQKKPSLPKSKK